MSIILNFLPYLFRFKCALEWYIHIVSPSSNLKIWIKTLAASMTLVWDNKFALLLTNSETYSTLNYHFIAQHPTPQFGYSLFIMPVSLFLIFLAKSTVLFLNNNSLTPLYAFVCLHTHTTTLNSPKMKRSAQWAYNYPCLSMTSQIHNPLGKIKVSRVFTKPSRFQNVLSNVAFKNLDVLMLPQCTLKDRSHFLVNTFPPKASHSFDFELTT